MMKHFLPILLLALLLMPASAQTPRRPNIVLVNTDDQPSWWVGAYGNKEIHTPNMDRLAKDGMLFKTAVSVPVCSPSRAMLLTGRYNHQVGIDDFINDDEVIGLPNGSPTFARILRDAGYVTGIVGKWHLGKETEFWPTLRGFDYWAGFTNTWRSRDPELILKRGNNEEEKKKIPGFTLDILTDHAMEFLRENREKPFLLYVAYGAPHMGKMPQPPEDMAVYQGKKFTLPDYRRFPEATAYPEESLQERYVANYTPVTSVDRNLGRLLEELRKLGLENNTVVIFTSDNGYCLGRHGLMSKGNARFLGTTIARPNMFDDSIVVPFIVRWPGVVRPGSVCEEIVSHLDVFPTLMDLAGLDPGAVSAAEGFSIVPLLREQSRVWRDAVFLLYDMKFHAVAHMRMIRTRGWKLIHHYENERLHELYDLRNDPGELKNLHGQPAVRDTQHFLSRRLKEWEGRVGARKEDLLARHRPY
ncbi:MAG: sulfatase-like hydrolase/transferase [Opitutaceae bacterium]|nr:sulfatase-like hydrolase/transferase [Opitutaceae bacterium]